MSVSCENSSLKYERRKKLDRVLNTLCNVMFSFQFSEMS